MVSSRFATTFASPASESATRKRSASALAIVKWGVRFERTGDRLVEFQISYLLEHTTEGARILSYITQADQQAEMKALGLL
jgi:hypothetical protein